VVQRKVMISCALTGAADSAGKNPAVPVTPEQIAASAIDAAKAGAAIVHIHVRDPKTTLPSMDGALYAEVVDPHPPERHGRRHQPDHRTRRALPARPERSDEGGSRLDHAHAKGACAARPRPAPGNLLARHGQHEHGRERVREHAGDPRGDGDRYPRRRRHTELEVFETGHLLLAKRMIETGHIKAPGMFQICLGIAWGQPATPEAMSYMRNLLPAGSPVVRVRDFALPIPDGRAGRAARRPCARRA
jgi:hypothetical protein